MCSFGNLVRHSGIQPESAIIAALHIELMAQIGGPQLDSNQQPADYESVALPLSYGAVVVGLTRSRKSANHRAEFLLAAPQLLIALAGFEPATLAAIASQSKT